ncbi:hypothetical protein H3H54_10875 [Brachybacterium sp. Z12]|nr:hypothetical protein [Brachybacterium sp. Z12]QNN83651.1 hypothetical protein H3H54_10875 [Brachybacterium sp. Z12]
MDAQHLDPDGAPSRDGQMAIPVRLEQIREEPELLAHRAHHVGDAVPGILTDHVRRAAAVVGGGAGGHQLGDHPHVAADGRALDELRPGAQKHGAAHQPQRRGPVAQTVRDQVHQAVAMHAGRRGGHAGSGVAESQAGDHEVRACALLHGEPGFHGTGREGVIRAHDRHELRRAARHPGVEGPRGGAVLVAVFQEPHVLTMLRRDDRGDLLGVPVVADDRDGGMLPVPLEDRGDGAANGPLRRMTGDDDLDARHRASAVR